MERTYIILIGIELSVSEEAAVCLSDQTLWMLGPVDVIDSVRFVVVMGSYLNADNSFRHFFLEELL